MSTINAVARLKLFIEAAAMVGGVGWVPSADQWTLIMKKIMDLPEEPEAPPAPVHPVYHPAPVAHYAPPVAPGDGLFSPHPPVTMVPPQYHNPDPSMGGGPSQLPIKLRVNPDGSVPDSFS